MRVLAALGLTAAVFVVLLFATDLAAGAWFPRFERLSENFSSAYLDRELRTIARERRQALFIGDSVLWGYKIAPSESVVSVLRGSGERALLMPTAPAANFESALDRAIASHWRLYALRADLREGLFGQVDAAHALDDAVQRASGAKARGEAAHRPTADRFEGTYDLSPVDDANISLRFLRASVELLQREHIPAVAILTPTNHALLHEFIDTPQYAANLARVRMLLERAGVRVVDLDRAFAAAEFIDNDHLTVAGNRRLASLLKRELAP